MEKVKQAIEIACEGMVKDAFMIHKVFFNAKFGAICSNALNYVDAEKLKEFEQLLQNNLIEIDAKV